MASRKTKRKNMIQFIGLIVAVALVVVVSVFFQNWWNNRPATPPEEVFLTVSAGDQKIEVYPYSMCTPGVECQENDVPQITVNEGDTVHVEVPEAIHDHDWALLTIYDQPAANDEYYYGSYQQTSADVQATLDPIQEGGDRPKLVVIEINSVMIGTDENGEETPYSVTWSVSTNYANQS